MKTQERSVDLYRYVQLVLLLGLAVSLGLMLSGILLASIQGVTDVAALSPWEAILAASHLQPSGLLDLGILLLLATPVFRVAAALILFELARDHRYVVISLAVLGILAVSFLVAAA